MSGAYRQVRPLSWGQQLERSLWLWATVAALAWAGYGALVALSRAVELILEAGWGRRLGSSEPLPVVVSCALESACAPNLELAVGLYDRTLHLGPFVALVVLGAAGQLFRRYPAYKPAAAGRWATRAELARYLKPARGERLVGHLGFVERLPWLPAPLRARAGYRALAVPEGDWNEHALVYGPPGSGKTAGLFRPMLFRDALQGRSAVVLDVKYPDSRQGLSAAVGEFRALGRRVEAFTPFSEASRSLDLFRGCEDFPKALEVATVFLPLPEVKSDGTYYENQERRLLAALLMDGKLKGGVRLDEVLFRLKNGVAALQTYAKDNPHLTGELRTFLDLHPDKVAGVMTGLAAVLEPFCHGRLPSRLSGHGEPIDLERVFREPTLLFVGVPQADVIQGRGALVLRLVKRLVDEVGLRVAEVSPTGAVPNGTTVYLDEALNLGKLDKLEGMLATLRSRGIAYVLGVQSHDQGRAVYGRDVWEAIGKACRHKVMFLGALDPKEALEVSRALGEVTVFEQTVSVSSGGDGDRRGATTKEARRPLVSVEEMLTWPRFHAVVVGRNLPPFRSLCYPLFDPRHPDHRLHGRIAEAARDLPQLEAPAEPGAAFTPSFALAPPEDTPAVRLELARLVVRAVEGLWGCELHRERGKVVAVRLEPPELAAAPSVSGVAWDGRRLEVRGAERISEEFVNALVWLKRRGELEAWLTEHAQGVKGRPEYAGVPSGELEGATLWMPSTAVAEVFGRGFLAKKAIVKRVVDGRELEVVEVRLVHGGLEKLRGRLAGLEADAVAEGRGEPS